MNDDQDPKREEQGDDRFDYAEGDLVIEHTGDKPAPTGVETEPSEPPTIHIYE